MGASLTSAVIFAQGLGLVAMLLNFAMRALTDDRKLKITALVACAIWAAHFALLGAWAGMANNLVALPVILLSLWPLPQKVRIALIAAPLIPAPWVVAGPLDVLPICGAMLFSSSLMFLQGIPLRLALLVVSCLWLVYNLASGSIGGVVTEVVSILIVLVTISRMKKAKA